MIDTGVDMSHPELAGRIARSYDTGRAAADVTDFVGHGTFVSGLIAAIDGNGVGGKGVAGNTKVLAVRPYAPRATAASPCRDLVRGIEYSVRPAPT